MLVQYECENVLNDAALMEACGVGLSRTDMYGVMMVCKQLGEDPKLGVATVRFFGKVVIQDTTSNDRQLFSTCLLFGVWYLPCQFCTYPISCNHCTVEEPQCTLCSACWHQFCCTIQAIKCCFFVLLAATIAISKLIASLIML